MTGERVLIIEDDPEYVEFLLAEVLAPYGYLAQAATTWREGLEAAQEKPPDLVLLDLNLNEITCTEMLHQLQISGDPPVILLSPPGAEAEALKAVRLGARDALVRPLTAEEMARTVGRVLQRERMARERDWLTRKLAGANEALEKSLNEAQTLQDIIKTLFSSLNLDDIFATVVRAATMMTRAEEGYLLLLNQDTDELYLRAAQYLGEQDVTPLCVPVNDSIARHVVCTNESIALSSQDDASIRIGCRQAQNGVDQQARALVNLPLCNQQQTIGVLGVNNVTSNQGFTQSDVTLLSMLTECATTAIVNALVFTQTREKLDNVLADTAAAQSRTNLILRNISEGVFTVNRDLRITSANPAMEKLAGWQESELLGHRYDKIFAPETNGHKLPLSQPLPGQSLQTQSPLSTTRSTILHKDGRRITVIGTAVLLTAADASTTGALLTIRDPKQTQPQQPSRGISQTHSLQSAQLDQLVGETLDTLHSESGTAPAGAHPVTLRPIITQVVEDFQDVTSGNSFQVTLAPDLPFAIGNESKIELALVSLIENALVLSDPEQPILISADSDNDDVVVAVEGTGLARSTTEHMDSPHPLYDAVQRGTPWWATPQIKFYIARKLIQAQGGQVWVESRPGTSARFHFSLPKVEEKDVAQAFVD